MLRQLKHFIPRRTSIRGIHATMTNNLFYEKDPKGGYTDNRPEPSKKQLIKDGIKELKEEIALWSKEVKEHLEADPFLLYRPGETDIAWRFNEKNYKDWIVTSDSDNNEGYSHCTLSLNSQGHAVFSGELSTKVPKDGRVKRSGYCNIKSLPARVRKLCTRKLSILDISFRRNHLKESHT